MPRGTIQIAAVCSLLVAACSSDPCTSVIDPSMVVRDAAGLRVDVYDAPTTCAGLATGAGAATAATQLFTPGKPITLHLAPGTHAVMLTTFSDAALTVASGRGCADVDATAGSNQCLTITVDSLAGGGSDGGAPGDMALPSAYVGLPACAGFCQCSTGSCNIGSCGPGCDVVCSGDANCGYSDVASGTLVECQGNTLCTVQCQGSCAVECAATAACRLQCAGDPSSHVVTGLGTCP